MGLWYYRAFQEQISGFTSVRSGAPHLPKRRAHHSTATRVGFERRGRLDHDQLQRRINEHYLPVVADQDEPPFLTR